MIADVLTKLKGLREALVRLLTKGRFNISAEDVVLKDRKEERLEGRASSSIRRQGLKVKEKLGNWDSFCFEQLPIDL